MFRVVVNHRLPRSRDVAFSVWSNGRVPQTKTNTNKVIRIQIKIIFWLLCLVVQEATGMNFTLWWTIEWHVQQVIQEPFKSPSSLGVFICCVEDPFWTHNLIDKHITNWSWLKLHHLFTVFTFTLSKSNKSPQIENTRDSPWTFRENRKLKSWVQLHKSLLQKQSYSL